RIPARRTACSYIVVAEVNALIAGRAAGRGAGGGWCRVRGCWGGWGRRAGLAWCRRRRAGGGGGCWRAGSAGRGWAGQARGEGAWVGGGRGERDPLRFWLSVLAALRQTAAGSVLVREVTAAPDLDG